MRPVKLLSIAIMLTGIFALGKATAQIKIGTNGAVIAPSSLLELESNNQGLLLPRMADTVAINALNPPNGMLIYLMKGPAVGLYVRKVTGWEYLTGSLGGNGNFNSLTVAGSVTATNFSGNLTGTATRAIDATNSLNSTNSAVTDDVLNSNITFPVFVNLTPGNQPLKTSSGNLYYRPSTGELSAKMFIGPLTGDITGNASSAIEAQNAVNIRVTDDLSSQGAWYPTFVPGTTGPLAARVSSQRLSFVPRTGELAAPIFRGALLGNATSATNVRGVVKTINGGTGHPNYSPGDILYAFSSDSLTKLSIGPQGTILRVDPNLLPVWSTAGAGTVTNVVGTANRIRVVNATVSPIINIDSNYVGQPSINTLGTITNGIWNAGVIPTTYGGTGANAFTANEILIGGGTGLPIKSISLVGTAGKVLTSNGTAALPTFETPGIGDMVRSVDQTIDGIKRFNDGTLLLKGSGTGITTLKSDANTNGIITLPGGTRTLVSIDGTETLTNKTLTAPNMTGTANFQTLSGTQLILNNGTPLTNTDQTGTPGGKIVLDNAPTIVSPTFTGTVNAGSITSTGTITATLFNGPASTANNTGTGVTLRDASTIATAVDRANGATDVNTLSALVKRDAAGNFSAGTITATLSGNATNVSGVVAIANGGTGAATKTTGFNALSPLTSQGDIIYGGVAGTGTRLSIGSATQVLKGGATAPVWGSVVLTTDVSNILPPANGGTGVANTNRLTLAGADITLNATGATNITLPTTGTLTTLAGAENLTNKTLNGTIFTGSGGTLSLANGNVFTTVGANPITLTSTAPTTLTLPTSGTLAATASPAFTGTPTAPTAGLGTNTTQIATTAFVIANSGLLKFVSVSPSVAPAIAAGTEQEVNYPAAGASTNGTVVVSPEGVPQADLGIMSARVSVAGVVTVRYRNFSAGPITPNVDLHITVIQ